MPATSSSSPVSGPTTDGQITTLGRGGSDLTAIALAAALKADLCQIYTDVDGVYTADPRIVPSARKLPEISYDEMLELARSRREGDAVRSVEFAKKFGVIFEVRSSMNDNPGTIVKEETRSMEDIVVRGVALDKNQAKVTLVAVPDKPGRGRAHFQGARRRDDQRGHDRPEHQPRSGAPARIFPSPWTSRTLLKARKVIEGLKAEVGYEEVAIDEKIGKLSIVGVGMRTHSGVAAKMFETLATKG